MTALTIKNIPPELYEQIKTSAQMHRRSINNEVLTRLEESLRSTRVEPNTFLSKVDTLQKQMTLPFLTDEELAKMKAEGRK